MCANADTTPQMQQYRLGQEEVQIAQCDSTGNVLISIGGVVRYALAYDKVKGDVKCVRVNPSGGMDYALLDEVSRLIPDLRGNSYATVFYDPNTDPEELEGGHTVYASIETVKQLMRRAAEILAELKDHVGYY